MEKKIMIAVDGSPASERAIDYVGLMEGAMIRELTITLFTIMTPVPTAMRREAQKDQETFRRVREMERRYKKEADEILSKGRDRLLRHGIEAERIELKGMPRAAGLARDILFEAEHGMYDALVMGRRGLSKAQELFMGSVTNKVVQHAERVPVWIVGGRITSLKVLLAVDGSEGALKAVDHLTFMLSENPECTITLFHVGASLANYCTLDFNQDLEKEIEGDLMRGEEECMDDFYRRAYKILKEAGFSDDQIETRTREGAMGVAGAILKEVEDGDYGTVVVGRRGENRSFFLGHVSDKIISRCDKAAVWVVG